jgi:single-stranded-DNA-specific exonuclease
VKKKWIVRPHDPVAISAIEKSAGVSPIIAQLLAVRGMHDPVAIRRFIDAPLQELRAPQLLPGVDAAVERVVAAIANHEKIVIYGDYDADGMTASAILVRCIRLLGGNVHSFVPSRIDDGYGLNDEALDRIEKGGATLVITVDCGIASVAEAETARRLGMDLIITDHHQYGSSLPDAVALVHPGLPGSEYPFSGLCGAGVALKLAWALCQRTSGRERVVPAHRSFLLVALGLAAIGTVADVVPLVDENRLIVRHGLAFMRRETVTGLTELFKLTGLSDKPAFDAEDAGFTIGPRLNAAGRLGQAQLAVELLTTDSQPRATSLAEYINQLNGSRESLERKIQKAAFRMIAENNLENDAAIVLADRDWHVGIIGIVAGRVAERLNRPVVLVSRDETGINPGTGSGRSAGGVDLYAALDHCRAHLAGFGGHRAAAGLRIHDDQIDAFRDALIQYVAGISQPEDFQPRLEIDLEVPLSHLSLKTVTELEKLAPFGMGNRRPVFCACGVRLVEPPQRIGGGERHLALKLVQHNVELRSVAFGSGERAGELDHESGFYDFAFRPVINHFRGRRTVELQLIDWRESSVPAAVAH